MKKYHLSVLFCLLYIQLYAQIWVRQWDKQYGSAVGVNYHTFMQTADKGYLLGCIVFKDTTGDISEPSRDTTNQFQGDYWFIKLNADGEKEWDKRLGGGAKEYLFTAIQTLDGGYIAGGYSESQAGGDKSQNSKGYSDYWVVKLDAQGNKQWDKTYGTSSGDELTSIIQNPDSTYLLAGTSGSVMDGDKTDSVVEAGDYWIIKTDAAGNKLWDKVLGGLKSDYLNVALRADDGGYLLAGNTTSGIGGDKTQSNWDTTEATSDIWVVKTDSLGNKQWDKRYGGVKNDGVGPAVKVKNGYVLAGISASPVSGDISKPPRGSNPASLYNDYLIIKIDASGSKLWDKRYGALGDENLTNIHITSTDGYLLGGTTNTPMIDGDKTEVSLGSQQSWIIKTDSVGDKLWDKTIFTKGGNGQFPDGQVAETDDGCYVVANCNNADTGGYKTQARWGVPTLYNNLWLVKLCIEDTTTAINETKEESIFTLYPNPTTNQLTIQATNLTTGNYQITTTTGQLILQSTITQPNFTIDVSTLPPGLYFLQLTNGQQRAVKRFVKQ